MRIIISPAKKMKVDEDSLECQGRPVFLEDTDRLLRWMQGLSREEARALWGCNEKLAEQNFRRLQEMRPERGRTPAILSYEGIQYQYMAPAVFEEEMLRYVQEHLRILSGFYGVLKPLDGVTPYRLEMQAKPVIDGVEGLYRFWGRKLYEEVTDASHVTVNLASKEYSKCIEAYLKPEDRFITCVFGELSGDRIIQKGVYAKMARGEMVRFLAEHQITEPEEMRSFCGLGYRFREELSTDTEYIFVKTKTEQRCAL